MQVRLHGSRGGVFVGHRPPRDPGGPLQIIEVYIYSDGTHTHTLFLYTRTLSHTLRLLDTDAYTDTFTHRRFYTQTLLHTDAFTFSLHGCRNLVPIFCYQHGDPIHFLMSGSDYVWHYWKTYIVFEKYYQGIYFRSNCLGWFACYRTQFLTDLFKDPFLSSAISTVAPTWCHGAIGGNPFVCDWGQTWFPNSHTLTW